MRVGYEKTKTTKKAAMEGGSAAIIAGALALLINSAFPEMDAENKAGAVAVGTAAIAGAWRGIRNWWKHR